MINDIIFFSEKLIGETFISRNKDLILTLLFLLFLIYKKCRRYFKYDWNLHPVDCNCDPNDVFNQIGTDRPNVPIQCSAGKRCISNALYDLVKAIDEAFESIDIAMPELSMTQLQKRILSANSRLVKIRIILNYSEGLEDSSDVQELLDNGKNSNCL